MNSTVKCLEVNFDNIFSRMRFDIMIKRCIRDIKLMRNSHINGCAEAYITMGKTITDYANKTMVEIGDMPHSRVIKKLLYEYWFAGIGLYFEGMMRKGINPICPHAEKDIFNRDTAMTTYGNWNNTNKNNN